MMSDSDLKAFGVTREFESAMHEWIMQSSGCLLGKNGRGGSGIFLKLKDGATAFLTAKHVIAGAIISGQVSISTTGASATHSVVPIAIRFHRRRDAGYLIMPPDFQPPHAIEHEKWSNIKKLQFVSGMVAISSGAPGLLKSEPNLILRSIELTKILHYWTSIKHEKDQDGLVTLEVDSSNAKLPETLSGMSGGPVVDLDKNLLGINVSQNSKTQPNELYFLAMDEIYSMFEPFVPTVDAPSDYERQEACLEIPIRNKKNKNLKTRARIYVEFWRSKENPDHNIGKIGRITEMRLGIGTDGENYRINVESIFALGDDSQETNIREIRWEANQILNDADYEHIETE